MNINKLIIATTENLDPYRNLAYEEYLFDTLPESAFILYLWRNDNTVVVGLNQNPQRECNIPALIGGGGKLARRKTGGGAVYHDKHNLNFTFIGNKSIYDVKNQLDIIRSALYTLGIESVPSGRNDIVTLDGRKFSGNAFLSRGDKCLHHGTILIDTDYSKIAEYLTVHEVKLQAKGVKSVVSRVVNLKTLQPDLTVDKVKNAVIEAAKMHFRGADVEYIDDMSADKDRLQALYLEYSSEAHLYGATPNLSGSLVKRFEWGTANACFSTKKGIINEIKIYTDSLDTSIAGEVERILTNANMEAQFDYQPANDILELIKNGG
jgi:lipoate-protein ligase A